MNRRKLLISGVAGVLAVTGAVTSRKLFPAKAEAREEYAEDDDVVYDHEAFQLRASRDAISRGEAIEFEVTNSSESNVALGCDNPWAIERRTDDEWRTVAWTGDEYAALCLTTLSPGESQSEQITLSTDALESRTGEVRGKLQPGQYRFVLLGPSPFLAVDFRIL